MTVPEDGASAPQTWRARIKTGLKGARGRIGRALPDILSELPELLSGGGGIEGTNMEVPEGDEGPIRRRWKRRIPSFGAGRRQSSKVDVIEARPPRVVRRLGELWRYRRLTLFFGWQYVEKLYRNTWLGWLWIPLRPVLSVGSRVLIYGGLLRAPSDGVPYLLFFLVGAATWQMFSFVALWSTRSIEQARSVLRRMYVPRLTALVGAVVPALVNFGLYAAIGAITAIAYLLSDGTTHLVFEPQTALVIVGLALCVLLGLSIGLWTSVFGAQTRDMRFSMNYILGFWFFMTPVIYPFSRVPESFKTVASLNPMTGPVELVRLGAFGTATVPTMALISCGVTIVVVGVPGLWFFNRSESKSLDSL